MPQSNDVTSSDKDAFELDKDETDLVGGASWGGAMFGAIMGAEFGPAGVVGGAILGHMLLD